MDYTVEELHRGWEVVARELAADDPYIAVDRVSRRPGMYRTAASVEPERRYFWLPPHGQLEAMDR